MKKIRSLILAQLKQGASPRGLAMSCAVATMIGLFPLLGTTTVLCLLVGTKFRLNQALMQATNYLLTPVHLIAIPIFLKIGEFIMMAPEIPFDPQQIVAEFTADWRLFLTRYGMAGVHAVLAWALISPVIGFITYHVTFSVFLRLRKRASDEPLR